MSADIRWDRFAVQVQKDLKHWLYCMAALQLFRIIFIITFRGSIGEEAGAFDVLGSMANGFRFDAKPATVWILPVFFCSVACGFWDITRIVDRIRYGFAIAFTVISLVTFRIAIGYYGEYNNVFDHWIFGMIYDDAGAVMSTVWTQYNVPLNVIFYSLVAAGLIWLLRRYLKNPFVDGATISPYFTPLWRKIALGVSMALLLFAGGRGTFGWVPLKLLDAGVTKDEFLNKAVVNPYMALAIAIGEHQTLARSSGLRVYLKDGDVAAAARRVFGTDERFDDLDRYMQKTAAGPKGTVPRHVFVIIMESYDSWPFLDEYRSLRLTEHVARLGRDGAMLLSFLPASHGTMRSLATVVTNLPDAGVYTNYRPTAKQPYPSSIAPSFKRLGYTTRFFYAGFLSWQRIGDFCHNQGFDEVYGGGHMGSWVTADEWGVNDKDLYAFIESKLNDSAPSLNVILTTMNHPPYNIDVYGEGFHLKEVPQEFTDKFDGKTPLNVLGHLWYSDVCVGEFVERVEKKLPKAIFAITGDHFSRKFLNVNPSFYEKNSVPLVLYGKEVLNGMSFPEGAAGAHIDIAPTLLELAAPEGFEYHTMGSDLFIPTPDAMSFSRGKAISAQHIFGMGHTAFAHRLPWIAASDAKPDAAMIKLLHESVLGVAWWRIMQGSELPAAE